MNPASKPIIAKRIFSLVILVRLRLAYSEFGEMTNKKERRAIRKTRPTGLAVKIASLSFLSPGPPYVSTADDADRADFLLCEFSASLRLCVNPALMIFVDWFPAKPQSRKDAKKKIRVI